MKNTCCKDFFQIFFAAGSLLLISACTASTPATDTINYAPVQPQEPADFALRKSKSFAPAAMASFDGYNFKQNSSRKLAYTTRLGITASNVSQAVQKSVAIAEKNKGYAVFSNNDSVQLKIPVKNATKALLEIEKLGEVTYRQIEASDVTENYVDTEVRLDNLKKIQKRLTSLLEKAKNVEETLKIERELSRVTTELEHYQVRMKNLILQTSMVNVHISFRPVADSFNPDNRKIIPVSWIKKLGIYVAAADFSSSTSCDEQPAKIKFPAHFVIVSSDGSSIVAADADSNVFIMQKHLNIKGATLEYYKKLIAGQLEYAGYSNIKTEEKVNNSRKYLTISARKNKKAYHLAIFIVDEGLIFCDKKVYVAELFGNADQVKPENFQTILDTVDF